MFRPSRMMSDRENQDEFRYRSEQLRHLLENFGFRVESAKIHCEPIRMYEMMRNDPMHTEERYYNEWTLRATDDLMQKVVGAEERIDSIEKFAQDQADRAKSAEDKLRKIDKKKEKLKMIFKNNPGLEDQWNEMQVMFKLAGMDDTIL